MHEFYRRQRRATLLVAGSLAAAVVLTFGGFLLVGSLMAHGAKTGDNRPPSHSTSVAWQRPLLRVEAEQQAYQPTASTDWASALLDLTPSPSAALDPVVPAIHGPAQEGEKPAR